MLLSQSSLWTSNKSGPGLVFTFVCIFFCRCLCFSYLFCQSVVLLLMYLCFFSTSGFGSVFLFYVWIWECVSFLRVNLGVCFFSTCGFGSVFLFYMWIWECVSVRDYGGRCGSGLVGVVVLVLAVAIGGDHGCGSCCHRFRGCGFGRCDGIHHRWVVAGQDGLGHGGNGDCHDGGHDGSYRPKENMVHIFEIICINIFNR